MKENEGTFEQAVATEYSRLLHSIASGAAREIGAPPDSVTLSKDDEQARWEYRNPQVAGPGQLDQVADMVAAGIVAKYAESGQPLPDPETFTRLVAAQVSRVHTGGQRRELISRGYPDPDAQVKRAEGFSKRGQGQPPMIEEGG